MEGRGYVSLFSGGMGLDLGLEQAGFEPLVCNEIDSSAVKTIRRNRQFVPVVSESITEVTGKSLESAAAQSLAEVPLVAGGPPCQAFSVYGKRQGTEDSRGQLIYEFLRIVSELLPKTFLMENVRGLHSMAVVPKAALIDDPFLDPKLTEHGSLLREVLKRFEAIGYRVDCFLVNCVNYGAPQLRERLICIGNRFNLKAKFPQPQYSNRSEDRLPPFRTLGDAIGPGFTDPDPDCMNFSPRKLKYLEMVPEGGNWRSLPVEIQKESMGKAWHLKGGRSAYWRKLSFEFPSPTVVTMPNHAGTSMCHPTELRALTVGELAAIQEFPADWRFEGKATDKCRQIGNAVPVRLGTIAGSVICELLKQIAKTKSGKVNFPSCVEHIRPHVRTRTFWKAGQAFAGDHGYYNDGDDDEEETPLTTKSRQPSLFD
jgi:DNA (cytosine-5)-methyltransferase 1